MASDAMQPSASMTAATAAGTAADGPPAKKKRGSSGLPRGVSQTGSSKFQGRINYMPPGSRQRGIGTFDTAEEAGLAVAEAEAKLKEQGPEAVWPEPARGHGTDQQAQAWRGASNAQSPPALLVTSLECVTSP